MMCRPSFPCGLVVPVVVLLVSGCVRPGPAHREEKPAPEVPSFVDVRGGTYRLPGPGECKATALVFIGSDCPISNGYAPEVVRLCREFSPQGIAFCVVYADADLTKEEAAAHVREYGYPCPALLDPEMRLARKVGATVKPEAAVLSPEGEVLYLGRIDDQYADFGKRRAQPTRREFREALEAVTAGRAPAVKRTRAIGCDIEVPAEKPADALGGSRQ
jgi:hypothetical protein